MTKAAFESKLGDSCTNKGTILVKKIEQNQNISASGNSTKEKTRDNRRQNNDDQTHFVT